MKTKTIPFDLETAKKIQAGEIKGKIKTRDGRDVRVICWDKIGEPNPIMALIMFHGMEALFYYDNRGIFTLPSDNYSLVLEVPDNEPQFKPFDRVLVRDEDDDVWVCELFSHYDQHNEEYSYVGVAGMTHVQCIPFEGNQDLVGTTDKPKED